MKESFLPNKPLTEEDFSLERQDLPHRQAMDVWGRKFEGELEKKRKEFEADPTKFRENLIFVQRSFLTPYVYGRVLPKEVDTAWCDNYAEKYADFARKNICSLVMCESPDIMLGQRVSEKSFFSQDDREVRLITGLGGEDDEVITELKDQYNRFSESVEYRLSMYSMKQAQFKLMRALNTNFDFFSVAKETTQKEPVAGSAFEESERMLREAFHQGSAMDLTDVMGNDKFDMLELSNEGSVDIAASGFMKAIGMTDKDLDATMRNVQKELKKDPMLHDINLNKLDFVDYTQGMKSGQSKKKKKPGDETPESPLPDDDKIVLADLPRK